MVALLHRGRRDDEGGRDRGRGADIVGRRLLIARLDRGAAALAALRGERGVRAVGQRRRCLGGRRRRRRGRARLHEEARPRRPSASRRPRSWSSRRSRVWLACRKGEPAPRSPRPHIGPACAWPSGCRRGCRWWRPASSPCPPPVCVAWPPTTRSTPLPSVTATSPCAVAGLNTNLSMTIDEFGPMLKVVLSMKRSCTLPEAEVSIFSLVTTWVPISITRRLPPGGVPVERVFAAPAVPTVAASARPGCSSATSAAPARSRNRSLLARHIPQRTCSRSFRPASSRTGSSGRPTR